MSVSLTLFASSVKIPTGGAIFTERGPMPVLVEDNKDWGVWGGLERIDINIEDPQEVNSTCQLAEDNKWITYQVTTEVEKKDGLVRYHIHYAEEENRDIIDEYGKDAFIWGTHTLILEEGRDSGESIWNNENGPGWKLEQLIGERRRTTTTRLQRAQDEFRRMLIVTDGCCALTRETCREALEAAHIVPVKCGGQEVLPNGILLRADLHRIYDAGGFDICPKTGVVLVNQPYKSFDLKNAKVKKDILPRIAEALRTRANPRSER